MMKPVTKSTGGAIPNSNHATLMPLPPKLPTCSGVSHAITMSPADGLAGGGTTTASPVY